jgi:hypothetical protein
MDKLEFQKIMEALEGRLELCKQNVGNIKDTDSIRQLTIQSAVDLKSFCVAEEEVMTRIVMVDLYHIIGMGELTPPQMMKFTYAIQKYLRYRPTIKAIAKSLDSIFELPVIPVETRYKLQGLGDLALYADGRLDDDASIEDYNKYRSKNTRTNLPFRIEGRKITVDMEQFDFFVTLMTNLTKSPLSADNFRTKLRAHKEYLGIEWTEYNLQEAKGHFKSEDMFVKLSGYYNGHK